MPKKKQYTILFAGGGTGGHIFPIVAIAREIRKIDPNLFKLAYVGPRDSFDNLLLSQEGIAVYRVASGKIRRYWGIKAMFLNVFDLLIFIPLGIFQSFVRLFFLAPDVIVSKGGYGSLPTVLASRVFGIPLFLHESDIAPGISNRIVAKFALEIFVSFPRTLHVPLKKLVLVGNPIRQEMLEGSKDKAKELFRLQGEKPVLLFLGGSQGSLPLNEMLLAIINDLLTEFEVIHQTGTKQFGQNKREARVVIQDNRWEGYHPVPFLKEQELRHAYAIADFIINRAGSGSIFEIAALGKPSILIPLPHAAQNHQAQNAYAYADTGASIVLEEANLTPRFFLEKIRTLFRNPQEQERMREAARMFARPNAARVIAHYIADYLRG
ncbi:MAG: UDP-N-acetylglucosamine--N-acetylmuramyl-(pentapeptide) pyrophosphoryl-undecaprenol N-acetylglucosamine transferase [bacterium]|nr:UDP-N-acetylglucosamine--N-acetylmuramyl-(pentapeptide) pyrophosphoryl-undecaprenol N-acetylglucosamine transferase [bacterium]